MPVEYVAPTRDMRFVIEELVYFDRVSQLPGCEEFSPDLIEAILEEAGKFANGVISPLNWPSDQQGAQLQGEAVKTSPGFQEAYAQFVESGWNSLSGNPDFGGQGLPEVLATCVNEMWHAASMSFALCPMLTAGAIHAIEHHGSQAQKDKYLAKLISGEWTGTMNLTEPQAGSDLAAVAAKAWPLLADHPLRPADASDTNPSFCVHGTKIYITHGEHDLADNIIHLVLARLPDAPAGVKGISLFLVPKFLVNDDGSLGQRNDVKCVSLEHKLGIHGSPTAVMSYGEKDGAVGYLIGEPNRGLEYMFTMMNHARLNVGLQGVAIAERAYQQAHWYAHDRVQGKVLGHGEDKLPIAYHPDVRRMLASMQSRIQAMRALAYEAAAQMDIAARASDTEQAKAAQARVDLLIPVVKAWCTEQSIDIASMGIQVHGGMGYVEETGAAQHLRDARITTIYEGTTAIQANDFMGRKILRDDGAEITKLLAELRQTANHLSQSEHLATKGLGEALRQGTSALQEAVDWVLSHGKAEPAGTYLGAVPLVQLAGFVLGGWVMGRAALQSIQHLQHSPPIQSATEPFYATKLAAAGFYASHVLLPSQGLLAAVKAGNEALEQAATFTGGN
jgi:alkylation response protein AidB-like acyl-CoA dehydrogenase